MAHLKFPEDPDTRVTDLVVPRSNSLNDLLVSGDIIARISSDPHGMRDRWTELYIIETDLGKFVGISIGRSALPGESDIVDSAVATKLENLREFFTVNGKRSGLSMVLFDQVQHRMTPGVDRV